MDKSSLEAVLASAGAKDKTKEGFFEVPEGKSVTLYAAHGGVSLGVPKASAVKIDGALVHAKTQRGETYIVELADVFAASIEGSSPSQTRRAGFI